MGVTVIIELSAKDELIEELAKYLKKNIPDTRSFDGCENATIYRNKKSPSKFLIVTKWDSDEAPRKYMAWRTERGDAEKLDSMCSNMTLTFYDIFDE